MKKKVLAVMLATAMVCSLAACGGGEEAAAPDVAPESTEEAAPAADAAETETAGEEAARLYQAPPAWMTVPLTRTTIMVFLPLLRAIPTAR